MPSMGRLKSRKGVVGLVKVGRAGAWNGMSRRRYRRHAMRRHPACGVWEIFVPHAGEGDRYKFELLGADGVLRLRIPKAAHAQPRRIEVQVAA